MNQPFVDIEKKVANKSGNRGAQRAMKDGHARTVRLDPGDWERAPSPKSAFLREAIDSYLICPQDQPERMRASNGRFTQRAEANLYKVTCVYLPDAQWENLVELSGSICCHIRFALRRALDEHRE